ncbi:MAG: hypothetical protein E7252_00870 [Lachnospira sp.]|nr:hypothetical protein [Lachnospira sp.]
MKEKKYIVIALISSAILIGLLVYYVYRMKTPANVEDHTFNNPAEELIAKDIEGKNYPATPREVVKLYTELVRVFYNEDLTEAQIEALGRKARMLFDEELKAGQTEEEYLEALKLDIKAYNDANRTVNECIIQRAQDNVKVTVEGKDYYIIKTVFYLKESKKISTSYMDFKVRKNGNNWKILSWGMAESSTIKGE